MNAQGISFCAAETNLGIQKVKQTSHFISSTLIYAIILLATVHFLTFWYTDISYLLLYRNWLLSLTTGLNMKMTTR